MPECLIQRAGYVTLHATTKEALMPTTPNTPASTTAVDRLVLDAAIVRGTQPSSYASLEFSCFEAEASSIPTCASYCFCAE